MDHLASMRAFVTVGRTQSFTKAAELLGVSTPQLSRAIADLEEHTHSLLFHRTTRRVSLADGARDYFETCTQILEQLEEAEQRLADDKNSVAGQLKVVAHPLAVVAGLASMLAAYGMRAPDVQIQLTVQAGPLNLEDSGYDVALYPPQLILNTTVINRPLFKSRLVLVAAEAYLQRTRGVRTLDDLASQALIYGIGNGKLNPELQFERDGICAPIGTSKCHYSVSAIVAKELALAGAGIAVLPECAVAAELGSGRLQRVLPLSVLCHGDAELGLQYPHKRLMSGRARSFVDECLDFFAPGNRIPEGPPSLLAA